MLTDYSCKKGDEMIARWKRLAYHLIVKYNDMAVRPENEDGTFKRNQSGGGARVQRPGYPERYAKELIKQTGTDLLVPAK